MTDPGHDKRLKYAMRDIAETKARGRNGCKYCDIGLQPFGGMHAVPGKGPVVCEVFWKRVIIRRREG